MTAFTAFLAGKKLRFLARRILRKVGAGALFDTAGWQPRIPEIIPQTMWIYWDQGLADAPALVQACVARWRECHPQWTIHVLDRRSLRDHVVMPQLPETIQKAHFADVLRTRLLAEHGGVWVDATTWCSRPLDHWLPAAAQAGFFVYAWTDADRPFISRSQPRILGNWFIAGAKGNHLIRQWDRATQEYWAGRQVTDNYFWHADAVDYLITHDPASRAIWQRMPQFGAVPPHLAQIWLTGAGGEPAAIRRAIAAGAIPVHKLNWRMDTAVPDIVEFLAFAPDCPQDTGASV